MFGEIKMDEQSQQIPPHERFGFTLLDRAFSGESLEQWENDYARLFWQLLEVHNGGYEQWIGNTGKAGALETLEALARYRLHESHRITAEAFQLGKLHGFDEEVSYYDYLEDHVQDWYERFRPLDEAYWNTANEVDAFLQDLYRQHTEQGAGPNGQPPVGQL